MVVGCGYRKQMKDLHPKKKGKKTVQIPSLPACFVIGHLCNATPAREAAPQYRPSRELMEERGGKKTPSMAEGSGNSDHYFLPRSENETGKFACILSVDETSNRKLFVSVHHWSYATSKRRPDRIPLQGPVRRTEPRTLNKPRRRPRRPSKRRRHPVSSCNATRAKRTMERGRSCQISSTVKFQVGRQGVAWQRIEVPSCQGRRTFASIPNRRRGGWILKIHLHRQEGFSRESSSTTGQSPRQ